MSQNDIYLNAYTRYVSFFVGNYFQIVNSGHGLFTNVPDGKLPDFVLEKSQEFSARDHAGVAPINFNSFTEALRLKKGKEIWDLYKETKKEVANVCNTLVREIKSGENKTGVLLEIREKMFILDQQKKRETRFKRSLASILAHQNGRQKPVLAIDTNWVAMLHSYGSNADPVVATVEVIRAFSSLGFQVICVLDPPTRHHTKQASIQRAGIRSKLKVDLLLAREKLLSLATDTPTNHDSIKVTESEIKKLEKRVGSVTPVDLCARLQSALYSIENVEVMTGLFQADSLINYMSNINAIDMILSSDTDYSYFIPHSIQITKFNISRRDRKLSNFSLCTSRGSILNLIDCTIKEPKYQVLDNLPFLLRH